jgi:hypothetical protein
VSVLQNLAPVYEEVADAFAAHKDKVQIIKVDADGEGRAAGYEFSFVEHNFFLLSLHSTTYGVQGFPSALLVLCIPIHFVTVTFQLSSGSMARARNP